MIKFWLWRQSKVWFTEPSEEFSTGTIPKEFSSLILVKIWAISEQETLFADRPKWSIAANSEYVPWGPRKNTSIFFSNEKQAEIISL